MHIDISYYTNDMQNVRAQSLASKCAFHVFNFIPTNHLAMETSRVSLSPRLQHSFATGWLSVPHAQLQVAPHLSLEFPQHSNL